MRYSYIRAKVYDTKIGRELKIKNPKKLKR